MPLDIVNYVQALKSLELAWQTRSDPNNKLELLVETIVFESQINDKPLVISPRPYSAIPNIGDREDTFRSFVCDKCKRLKHDLYNETAFYQDDNQSFYEYVVKPLTEQIVSVYIKTCMLEGYTCTDEMVEEIRRYDASKNITHVDKNRVHFEIMK